MKKTLGVTTVILGMLGVLLGIALFAMRRADSAQERAVQAKDLANDADENTRINEIRIEGIKIDVLRVEKTQIAMDLKIDKVNEKLDRVLLRLPRE